MFIFIFNDKCSYHGTRAYAQSKLAKILHTKELARQLKVRETLPQNFCLHTFLKGHSISN